MFKCTLYSNIYMVSMSVRTSLCPVLMGRGPAWLKVLNYSLQKSITSWASPLWAKATSEVMEASTLAPS